MVRANDWFLQHLLYLSFCFIFLEERVPITRILTVVPSLINAMAWWKSLGGGKTQSSQKRWLYWSSKAPSVSFEVFIAKTLVLTSMTKKRSSMLCSYFTHFQEAASFMLVDNFPQLLPPLGTMWYRPINLTVPWRKSNIIRLNCFIQSTPNIMSYPPNWITWKL